MHTTEEREAYLTGMAEAAQQIVAANTSNHHSPCSWTAQRILDDSNAQLRKLRTSKDMRKSLENSIRKAGGDTGNIMKDIDNGMTVNELLDGLGPNGVRFVCDEVCLG